MKIGDEVTVVPEQLVAGGAALARVDRLPVFVAGIYPGDRAIVRISETHKGFARAELVRLVDPSPLRRAAPCPIANECGGCDWTELRLDEQLRAKERILRESLRRIGRFDPDSLPPVTIHPSPLQYRLRSRLHRQGDAIGFYAARSNRVVQLVRECEVVGVATARRFGVLDDEVDPPSDEVRRRAAGGARETDDAVTIWDVDGSIATSGELRIEGYYVTADSFFQVNRHMLQTLLRLVSDHASGVGTRQLAIDLYSGVGFFSVPIAAAFERVIAVEGSPASHHCAKRNVPGNVALVNAPVEAYPMPAADFIFLDPPRAGARRSVIESIARNAREKISFLACDPVTFARDASRLVASGWLLKSLDLVDLFPNTHHVETLASFER